MIPAGLPLSHVRRQRLRDDRLWIRELERARQYNVDRIFCPCTECRGRRRLLLRNVRGHLISNGRHPGSRIWRGPGPRDSSDDEWEQHFWGAPENEVREVDATVDVRGMLQQPILAEENPQNVSKEGPLEEDNPNNILEGGQLPEDNSDNIAEEVQPPEENVEDISERVQREVTDAFGIADSLHDECMEDGSVDGGEGHEHGGDIAGDASVENCEFDPTMLEQSLEVLYNGARSS
jgi:hypothetical protein